MIGLPDHAADRSPSTLGERLTVHTEPQPDTGVLIVRVDGELDHATAPLLRDQAISTTLPVSSPRLVLDLGLVTFCDAAGLGALVAIRNAVHARHGEMVIAQPPRMCHRILQCTGLDQHIHIAATRDGAITHLTR